MANRTKFWHFNTSGGFYGELLSNTGLTDTPENRAQALVSTDNGCYHYIVFIKETDQIYTHGNLYDCSSFNGSEVKALLTGLTSGEILDDDKAVDIVSKLHYLINQNAGNVAVLESEKADKSEVEILRANVEENAEVTAKALNDLNDDIIENAEVTAAAIADLYDRVDGASSGVIATLRTYLDELTANVEENEAVTSAAINDLYSKVVTKEDLILNNILADDWFSDETYMAFPYRCNIYDDDIYSSDFAVVSFNNDEAISGNYSPVCETFNGFLSIWSTTEDPIYITIKINK